MADLADANLDLAAVDSVSFAMAGLFVAMTFGALGSSSDRSPYLERASLEC